MFPRLKTLDLRRISLNGRLCSGSLRTLKLLSRPSQSMYAFSLPYAPYDLPQLRRLHLCIEVENLKVWHSISASIALAVFVLPGCCLSSRPCFGTAKFCCHNISAIPESDLSCGMGLPPWIHGIPGCAKFFFGAKNMHLKYSWCQDYIMSCLLGIYALWFRWQLFNFHHLCLMIPYAALKVPTVDLKAHGCSQGLTEHIWMQDVAELIMRVVSLPQLKFLKLEAAACSGHWRLSGFIDTILQSLMQAKESLHVEIICLSDTAHLQRQAIVIWILENSNASVDHPARLATAP